MAPNTTSTFASIATPSCTLVPQAPLLDGISDSVLAIVLPTIVYAVAGGFFHLLDVYNLFSQYRIHPSEDELKRNRVTKWQVLQAVVRYHVMQISIGLLLNIGNGPPMVGDESCKINRVASVISHARNFIPMALAAIGVDAKGLANAIEGTSVGLAQVLAGDSLTGKNETRNSGLYDLELTLAKFVVSVGLPAFQYLLALTVVDTWIYFTHRLCHVNKTLYRKPLLYRPSSKVRELIISFPRHRPRPASSPLRLLRIWRSLRSLARDPLSRHSQLRPCRRNRPTISTAKHDIRLACHHQDYQ